MTKRKKLFWQLFPSYATIVVVALAAVSLFALGSMKSFYHGQTANDLEGLARVIRLEVAPLLEDGRGGHVDAYCKNSGHASGSRVTVIDSKGEVLGDTNRLPGKMENHAYRPEVAQALKGEAGVAIRYSETLGTDMMYVAVPVERNNLVLGVVRSALPMTAIKGEARSVRLQIMAWGVVTALLAGVVSLVVSRKISSPISDMEQSARLFAQGDFSHKLFVPESLEIGGLAEAMNQMAEQLDERIKVISRQRNEMEAVLTSMREGVLAVDEEMKIINMNPAARAIFALIPGEAVGFGVSEVLRNITFIRFMERAAKTEEPLSEDIKLWDDKETLLHVKSTPLLEDGQSRRGSLVVLNDVTRLRRLENIRKDFAANASHEMRTPLTCIKGAVETIQMDREKACEEHLRFYNIIEKNAERMSHLIEDLLELSRIEQHRENLVEIRAFQVGLVVETSLLLLSEGAAKRGVAIEVTGEAQAQAQMDPMLLERAVVNLLDNAVKYTPEGGTVTVSIEKREGRVAISVSDSGCGIEAEHIPRLFERFYRVDSARSRTLGGTGLGLAIVKHVMHLLKGEVKVTSQPGKGSRFTLVLPASGAG